MAPKRKRPVVAASKAAAPQPSAAASMKAQRGQKKTRALMQPVVINRNMTEVHGPRHAARPSKLARESGSFNATDVAWADAYDPPSDWDGDEAMPEEGKDEDSGWLPGPAVRALPKFCGKQPGPTDTTIDQNTGVDEFLLTQLTSEWRAKVVSYTIDHCLQWRGAHEDWAKDAAEISMKNPKKFTVKGLDIWLACRLRISQLKPELQAYSLWDRNCSLFDVMVFNAIT